MKLLNITRKKRLCRKLRIQNNLVINLVNLAGKQRCVLISTMTVVVHVSVSI